MAQVTADRIADQLLGKVQQKYGFTPNLIKEMVASPAVAQVYVEGIGALANASLSPKEQQAAFLAVSQFNGCAYCQAAHAMGGKAVGISPANIEAIRAGKAPQDPSLNAVVAAARLLLEKKGWLDDAEVSSLESRGITRAKLYEIVAIIGLKTISNYVNHISHIELDPQFKG